MTKLRKIAEQDVAQQKRGSIRQLSVTDLNNVAHGEEPSSMRNGFYTRRYRSQG